MSQLLIRNVDPSLVEAYRAAAKANQRSLEAELRLALQIARPVLPTDREALLDRLKAIRAMTPIDTQQSSAVRLVREDRER